MWFTIIRPLPCDNEDNYVEVPTISESAWQVALEIVPWIQFHPPSLVQKLAGVMVPLPCSRWGSDVCSRQCPTPAPSFPPNNLCWSQCPPCHLFPLLPRFVSPQFVAEPPLLLRLFPPSLWGRISLPSFPPSSSICGRIPSHCQPPVRRCILSSVTLPSCRNGDMNVLAMS